MVVRHRHGDVDHGKETEHQGLHDANEESEDEEGHGNQDGNQCEEGEDHFVVGRHVAHEAQSQGGGASDMTDELDGNHQWR